MWFHYAASKISERTIKVLNEHLTLFLYGFGTSDTIINGYCIILNMWHWKCINISTCAQESSISTHFKSEGVYTSLHSTQWEWQVMADYKDCTQRYLSSWATKMPQWGEAVAWRPQPFQTFNTAILCLFLHTVLCTREKLQLHCRKSLAASFIFLWKDHRSHRLKNCNN